MENQKPESSQEKKQINRFIVTKPEDANIEFVDSVQANWNPERVVLAFIQKDPGGAMPADLPEQEYGGAFQFKFSIDIANYRHLYKQ